MVETFFVYDETYIISWAQSGFGEINNNMALMWGFIAPGNVVWCEDMLID